MDTVRNVEWATSTCTLSFNTFGRLIKCRLPLSPCAASTQPFLTPKELWMNAFLSQESGQKEQTAQTSMLCAGHMTDPCWPLLMTLAKCTCSPSPAVSQGSVMFARTETQKISVRVLIFPSRCRHVDHRHAQSRGSVLMKAMNTTSTCVMWIISAWCLFCAARLLFNKVKCWVPTVNWSLTQLAVQKGWIPSSQMFGWALQGILL